MASKYVINSRLSDAKIRQLFRCFCQEQAAVETASAGKVDRSTADRLFAAVRRRLSEITASCSPYPSQRVELNPEYFSGGGGATRTACMAFGLVAREGSVYFQTVSNCTFQQLCQVVEERVGARTTARVEGMMTYECIADRGFGERQFFRCDANDECQRAMINEFCDITRKRHWRCSGIPDDAFELHARECEFRFNNQNLDIYAWLLEELRSRPLVLSSGNGPDG